MTWPRVEREPVVLPVLGGPLDAIWETLIELSEHLKDLPWTLVGGQMVLIHGMEHGITPPRVSSDLDAAVNVRAVQKGLARMIQVLTGMGFTPAGTSPEGLTHRFVKVARTGTATIDVVVDSVSQSKGIDAAAVPIVIDVLVPSGLGPRANTITVGGRAFAAPGVAQALSRTELVPLTYKGCEAWVPRPNLLGAIVSKATAAKVDPVRPDRHLVDLTFLLSLVGDPFELRSQVQKNDWKRLNAVAELLPPDHAVWPEGAGQREAIARATLKILLSSRENAASS